ncbi:MAG: hypothetical protein FWH03_05830 [Firmicutes bacterium]|nr:hypothetical protein [Bacillota bacterium]
MSVDKRNARWFSSIEKVFTIKMKALDGVVASKVNPARIEISVACESIHRRNAEEIIKKTLSEMYLTVAKFDYLESALKMPFISEDSYKILIHTLVAFDREAEYEIIEKNLTLNDYLALDGFFYFRLGELRSRWDEIAALACNNSLYLNNEETLNELLKFLMSAVTPKIQKLSVAVKRDSYNVTGSYKNSSFEFRIGSPEQLLIYLINIAPLELTLEGEFSDEKLYKRIVSIFDGKSAKAR